MPATRRSVIAVAVLIVVATSPVFADPPEKQRDAATERSRHALRDEPSRDSTSIGESAQHTERDGNVIARDTVSIHNRQRLALDSIPCERIPVGEPDDYKPCVARLPDGELLLTAFHQHKRDGNKVMEQTLLFRSRDGGKSWSSPEKLALLGREPYLTVLPDGTVFITGHLLANDERNGWGYTCGFLHRSTDRGRTWESTRIESEGIKPKASNHSTRNVLRLTDGTLRLGVDYDGGGGPFLMWRSTDGGQTWDKTPKCEPRDFASKYGFFGGETWLWQARSGKIWAFVRVDSNELPIKDRPIKSGNDQSDHFILFSSADGGKSFDRIRDFGDYGEMYMSLVRLQDKRLLLTFTVRDLKPPLGVRAIPGIETDDGFDFDFDHDRILLDTKTSSRPQGGGFGPTVQLDDGTLVTSCSYRGEDSKSHLEVVRWRMPADSATAPDLKRALVGHWPLAGDTQDRSGGEHHAVIRGGIDLQVTGPGGAKQSAAGFNGGDAWLEIPADNSPKLGREEFSVAVWLHTDEALDDVPGDLLSQYDPVRRRGFHLSLKSNAVTTSLANARQLHFGIDSDRASEWIDCGRPGKALLAFALTVHEGSLFAGTCEPGANETGRVYRFDGEKKWIDCGAPDRSNSVMALAVYNGQLYAGTGKYRVAGSSLPESENTQFGGRILRYAGQDRWIDCGQLPATEAVGGLIVFRGQLYASSLYRPAGFFRYDGETRWVDCGTPDGKRVVALGVFNGHLYATSYDGGYVYRYDGTSWTDCGRLGENTQTYSFAAYQGRLYVGTWPSGRVYRFEDVSQWTDVGRLGEELEVMGMLVHNGRLIAGTLPLAEMYSYEGNTTWKRLTRLDHTPDVKYRRAWTMAEHDGRLFCSTLPSGKIFAFEAGRNVTWGHSLPSGWHHIAAVKSSERLILYVDGQQVSQSSRFDPTQFDLNNAAPLRIGFGANDHLRGRLADLRLFRRAVPANEIRQFATQSK